MSSSGTMRPSGGIDEGAPTDGISARSYTTTSADIAVSVNGISKRYEIYETPRDRLKQFIFPQLQRWSGARAKQYFREFWALRDVSFEVKKGESFGIIGRNGSGKSTLLQIIAGTLSPTFGDISAAGRIGALLELGSGFNPDFTGRENVYLNAALLGLSKEETDERIDAIAGFADIGQFIDQPVKTYSSGMSVRLAFAVQSQLAPEILIVDEALSVGDFFFQQKCFKHIRRLRERGVTLLFVSHDMSTVRDMCNRAILLREGSVRFIGATAPAIRHYMSEKQPSEYHVMEEGRGEAEESDELEAVIRDAIWTDATEGDLVDFGRIIAIAIYDEAGRPATSFAMASTMNVKVAYFPTQDVSTHVSIIIKNRYDQIVTSTGSSRLGLNPPMLRRQEPIIFEIDVRLMLEAGHYSISVTVGHLNGPNQGDVVSSTPPLGPINIAWDYEGIRAPFLGMVGLPVEGRFKIVRMDS